MNCDPACIKTILNGGLVAPYASLLAEMVGPDNPMHCAAERLARVARAAVAAYDHLAAHGAITVTGDPAAWGGCKEAQAVMTWIDAVDRGDQAYLGETDTRMSAVTMMRRFERALLDQMAAMARGA